MKNNNIKYWQLLYLCLLCIITETCGGGINDRTMELSGGYVARRDGGITYILPDNIFNEGIYPNVVDFTFNKDFILVLQEPSKKQFVTFLSSDILKRYLALSNIHDTTKLTKDDYELFNKNLVADSSFYRMLSKELSPNNTEEDLRKSLEIAKKIISSSEYYQKILSNGIDYWIISHIDKKKYGPFTKEEFFKKASELGVPQELKQKFE